MSEFFSNPTDIDDQARLYTEYMDHLRISFEQQRVADERLGAKESVPGFIKQHATYLDSPNIPGWKKRAIEDFLNNLKKDYGVE